MDTTTFFRKVKKATSGTLVLALLFSVFSPLGNLTFAANTVLSAVYQDQNADGRIDTILVTFDENVTACPYEASDWAVQTG